MARKLVNNMLRQKKNHRKTAKFILFVYGLLLKNNEFEPDYVDENHHYIPQFILRNFKIENNEGIIYQYERGHEEPEKKSIKKEAACIRNYYDVPHIKTKGPSLMFEKNHYSELEYLAKIIIEDDILNNDKLNIELTDQRGSFLASYVAAQYTRTPAFKTQIKNYILFLFEKRNVEKELFSNKNKDKFINAFLKNSFNVARKELVEFNLKNKLEKRNIEIILRSRSDNYLSVSNLISVLITNKISEVIYRKKMFALTAKDPYFFVLPDCGVMIYDFKDEYDYFLWPYGWNLSKGSVSVLFPISPSRCLVYGGFDLNIGELNQCFVEEAIMLAYHQNHKYIFSDRKDKYIQKNINTFPITNYFT